MAVKKEKILLAEDEKNLAEVFGMKMESDGFMVDYAVNGLEALEKIKNGKYDLVLLDLVMPEKDGYGVLEYLKKNKAKNGNYVVIWSNLTQTSEIDKAKKLGADDYWIKTDYTPSKLSATIAQFLKNRHAKNIKKTK